MRRSFRFLLRPTSRQQAALATQLRLHAELYNAALQERRDAWRRARVSVSWVDQCRQLTEIRRDREDIGALNAQSCQQTLRRLHRAFEGFFRRVRVGQKPGFPRFRAASRFDSITFPQPPAGARYMPESGQLRVHGVGHVKVHAHRVIPDGARIKTVTIKREGQRWYVLLSCDDVPARPLLETGSVVGIDLGAVHLVTTSDGDHIAHPRHLATSADRLAAAQQALSRSKRGSNRRRKTRARVGAIHAKVHRQRLDHAHKIALDLIRRHDVLVHEALQIASLVRAPKPRPATGGTYAPNGAGAKAGLNRSILDAGWGVLLRVLADKAEDAGRTLIAVDPRHTSQRCAACGHIAAGNRVTQAAFRCLRCGHTDHADVNAARNILRAGLARREVTQ